MYVLWIHRKKAKTWIHKIEGQMVWPKTDTKNYLNYSSLVLQSVGTFSATNTWQLSHK